MMQTQRILPARTISEHIVHCFSLRPSITQQHKTLAHLPLNDREHSWHPPWFQMPAPPS